MANQPIIGCVQLNSQSNIESNLTIIQRAIEQAKQQGVHILVLPENACRMGNQHQLSQRFEEISQWYANLAFEHQLFIVAGTLPCPYRPNGMPVTGGRVRHVNQLFSPEGKRIARYDKIHLFRAEVSDDTGSYDEAETFEPGDTTVVASCDIANLVEGMAVNKTAPLNIGMMVCFDLRFPALAQRLRQAGADLLTAPSAFTYQTGKAHWELLLRARALDAQCLLVGAAQGGNHIYPNQQNRETWGHSAITNANGEIISQTKTSFVAQSHGAEDKTESNVSASTTTKTSVASAAEMDDASMGFKLITSVFDQQQQTNWRHDMPIHHCHRLA